MFQKLLLLALAVGTGSSVATAQNWFVRAGSEGGDGSQGKPFNDPWQAFERCQAGDKIHIAEGKYFGKLGVGVWEIPFDRVELLGGYTSDFKARDPWAHPSQLLWDKTSKNKPNAARLSSPSKDVVIDGITIDMRDENFYQDEQQSGRTLKTGDAAIYLWNPSTVRNCVVINPGQECVYVRSGATIENNLLLNALVSAVKVVQWGEDKKAAAKIRNNTILFSWDLKSPGTGNYRGTGISLATGVHAEITGNFIGHCDNAAIGAADELARTSITKNYFAMNLFSNLNTIDDKTMELLEEAGLKAFDGNEVGTDPLPLDPAFLDKYSQRTAGSPGKVVMDDFNKLRQMLGLNLMGTGAAVATGVAPPYALDKALVLVTGRKDNLKAGARVVALEVKLASAGPAVAAKTYTKAEILQWHTQADTVNGKDLEMVVAISRVTHVGGIPDKYNKDQHAGVMLHDVEGKGALVTGFYAKGTTAERVVNADTGYYQGSGKPSRLHLVRGTAYAKAGVPKAAFFIESIERYEPAVAAAVRPKGRDWFVRTGSTGGDGSKDKPFRDPFQALEKVQSGDSIHVAEGDYFGKLRGGRWKVDTTWIALVGGYDAAFTERAPWSHPTRLLCPADFKGTRGGYTLEGDADHTGLVVDGFIFDKRLNNSYDKDGNLADTGTDHTEHLWIGRPDCVVRNCIFLNGAESAIICATGQTLENNVFMNHMNATIAIKKGPATTAIVVRNNTILFSWERAGRFGKGLGYGGEAISTVTSVRATIDNNILQFSDNNAIKLNCDPKDLTLTNNVFAQNLWAIIYRNESIVDDKNFAQLGDLGFAKCSGNQLLSPGIALDQKWFDLYLTRTAHVPGKVQMDEWNQLREIMGQPMIATGGSAASCRAPAYDWKQALAMVPKNPKCTAGARPFREAAQFTGIARVEDTHEYAETNWDVAKAKDTWGALDGKRVTLKIAVSRTDNQYQLDDVKQEEYECFKVYGPQGIDGPGQPLTCYVKRGTTPERAMSRAKKYSRGVPDELFVLKGVARLPRILIVEAVEKAD